MEPFVFSAVLFAAACHAGWNAAIKAGLDPLAGTVLITTAAALFAVPLLLAAGFPAAPSWPWAFASVVIHVAYFAGLIEAYRTGELGQVYPIARGTAPLMTALVTLAVLGERIGALGWAGVVTLMSGVLLLSLPRRTRLAAFDGRAVGFALFTATTICAYSVTDGIGARLSENPHGYSALIFIGSGAAMAIYGLLRAGVGLFAKSGRLWPQVTVGGALQLGSYSIALWAMTLAPIAVVAALRETSVLFGALIAFFFLKEPLHAARIVATALVVIGLILLRLS